MNLAFDSDRGGRDQWVAWLAGILAECRRVLKPGGYALVWALPRTSHWTGMALEEAGFALRDQISHLFGSGFPKSQSCLKPAHEIWWLAKAPGPLQPLQIDACRVPTAEIGSPRAYEPRQDREQWRITGGSNGSGATSPAGRYPPNLVLSHVPPDPDGTGGCRPAGVRRVRGTAPKPAETNSKTGRAHLEERPWMRERIASGRPLKLDWAGCADADGFEQVQAWACVEECPVAELDRQAGPRTSGAMKAGTRRANTCGYRGAMPDRTRQDTYGDTGSASRFFPTFPGPDLEDAVPFRYMPKAPRSERRLADGTPTGHPTQKPVALACWLASLVCSPGGTILDPFAGVGSLGVGALRAGCSYLGIEQDAGYAHVARRRLAEEQEQQTGPLFAGVSPAST